MTMAACHLCGTRTGLHGFSFNKDGKYETEAPSKPVSKIEPRPNNLFDLVFHLLEKEQ